MNGCTPRGTTRLGGGITAWTILRAKAAGLLWSGGRRTRPLVLARFTIILMRPWTLPNVASAVAEPRFWALRHQVGTAPPLSRGGLILPVGGAAVQ